MAGNTFGKVFRVTTFGESHGAAVGVIVDGCPSGVPFDTDFIASELQRRRPGQSKVTTARKEPEEPVILSGVFEGITTGTPIAVMVYNKDNRSQDYSNLKDIFRPSHADYTYRAKYGHRDYRGGGRASARETLARVIAGAIAKMVLRQASINIIAYTHSIGDISVKELDNNSLLASTIESNIVRCPDSTTAKAMEDAILEVKAVGDTLGGIVRCHVQGVPPGLGEPVFDKLHAALGSAVLSIPACKGFEIGAGFESCRMKGSQMNDLFDVDRGQVTTRSNFSGGVQGGISNGQDIVFSAAFKPVSTIIQEQETIDTSFQKTSYTPQGRHDPCVVPRAVPIVEAMAAIVICDYWLLSRVSKL